MTVAGRSRVERDEPGASSGRRRWIASLRPRRTIHWLTAATFLSVVLLAFYVGLGLNTELQLIGQKPLPQSWLEDFGFYWRAYLDATNGRDPYAIRNIGPAFLYPPPALFVVALFSPFAVPFARPAAFLALNLTILGVVVWGIGRRYGYGLNRTWWWFPLAFAFGPVLETLHLGQMNLVTEFGSFLLFTFDGLPAIGLAAPILAGFGLSLAVVTKVTPVLFFAYLVAARSRGTLVSGVLWLVVMFAGSALAFGAGHILTYVDVFNGLTTVFLPGDGNSQGLYSVLNYLHWVGPGQIPLFEAPLRWFFAVVVALCVLLGLIPSQPPAAGDGSPADATTREVRPRAGLLFVTVAVVATIAPNLIWYHHWALLLLPLFVWIAESRFNPAVIAWVCFGMVAVQIDRYGWSKGLYAQAFAYASLLLVVAWQVVVGWRQLQDPLTWGRVKQSWDGAWSWLQERVFLAGETGSTMPPPANLLDVAPAPDLDRPVGVRTNVAARRREALLTLFVILIIVVGAAARFYGAMSVGQVADVAAYRNHVEVLRLGRSVYHEPSVYPYFPGWMDLEWGSWLLSQRFGIEFWKVIRVLIVSADVLTCFALWWAASRLHGPRRGRLAAALYALSPIAVLISGFHGQFEAIPTLLSVLAVGYLAGRPRAFGVGTLLGLAIAVKPNPALLVPVFLRTPKLSWLQRVAIGALVGLAVAAVLVASVGWDAPSALRSVLSYQGVDDQGLAGLLRSLWMYRTGSANLPGELAAQLRASTRYLALAMIALTFLLTWGRSVARASAAVYLAFLLTYSGLSTQYLQWPVAWLLLSDLPAGWAIVYGLGATFGALGFYVTFWPQIVLIAADKGGVQYAADYVVGEIVSWVTILATFVATIGRPRLVGRGRRAKAWLAAICVTAIVVVVSALPALARVAWFFGELVKAHH